MVPTIEKKRLRGRNRILLLSKFFTTLQEAMSAVACDVTQARASTDTAVMRGALQIFILSYPLSKTVRELHFIVPLQQREDFPHLSSSLKEESAAQTNKFCDKCF